MKPFKVRKPKRLLVNPHHLCGKQPIEIHNREFYSIQCDCDNPAYIACSDRSIAIRTWNYHFGFKPFNKL